MTSTVASSTSSSVINKIDKQYCEKKIQANYFKIFSRYLGSSSGAYRFFQVLKNGCKLPILYAKQLKLSTQTINKFFKCHKYFGKITKGLILTKIPATIDSFSDSYRCYKNADEKRSIRKRDRLIKKTAEVIADCSIFIQLGEMIGIYTLGAIIGPSAILSGSLFLLVQNIIDFKMQREDFILHSEVRKKEKDNIKDNERLTTLLYEVKNLDLLRLAKTVISIAVSIFTVAEFVFSMSILSPTALLLLSTSTTILAIWTHFYKESMSYPYKG